MRRIAGFYPAIAVSGGRNAHLRVSPETARIAPHGAKRGKTKNFIITIYDETKPIYTMYFFIIFFGMQRILPIRDGRKCDRV